MTETMGHKLILRAADICSLLGISQPCFYTWVRKGRFPKGFKYGPRLVGWERKTVEDWIAAQASAAASN